MKEIPLETQEMTQENARNNVRNEVVNAVVNQKAGWRGRENEKGTKRKLQKSLWILRIFKVLENLKIGLEKERNGEDEKGDVRVGRG